MRQLQPAISIAFFTNPEFVQLVAAGPPRCYSECPNWRHMIIQHTLFVACGTGAGWHCTCGLTASLHTSGGGFVTDPAVS